MQSILSEASPLIWIRFSLHVAHITLSRLQENILSFLSSYYRKSIFSCHDGNRATSGEHMQFVKEETTKVVTRMRNRVSWSAAQFFATEIKVFLYRELHIYHNLVNSTFTTFLKLHIYHNLVNSTFTTFL